jgi:YidC/Oxa1 family membrane protein insertase
MNQTRTFLTFALLAVAYLLFLAWQSDYAVKPPAVSPVAAAPAGAGSADSSLPVAIPGEPLPPAAAASVGQVSGESARSASQQITVSTDVLDLVLDARGGSIVRASLPAYPQRAPTHADPRPPATLQLNAEDPTYYVAQSGLVSSSDTTPANQPNHLALFQPGQASYTLAPGQDKLDVSLTWQGDNGLKVTKTYAFKRGSYVIDVTQRIDNGGAQPWAGNAYEQLLRAEPPKASSWLKNYIDPENRSFQGAAWYTGEKFEKLSFKDFAEPKDRLNQSITGG